MNPDLEPGALTKPSGRHRSPLKVARAAADRAGSEQVKARSHGWCEVMEPGWLGDLSCPRRATQVHHMLGGRGTRGIGISALAEHKQHVCDQCHRDITGDVGGKKLVRLGGLIPSWADRYRRVAVSQGLAMPCPTCAAHDDLVKACRLALAAIERGLPYVYSETDYVAVAEQALRAALKKAEARP